MNKLTKLFLSILAGLDILIYIITPILLATIWINVFGIFNFGDYLVYGAALGASLFRGIKVGWLK